MLADSAQAVGGKLYILGGGWSVIGPEPAPTAIVAKIEVPWNETNRPHTIRFELVDDHGNAFIAEGQEEPLVLSAEFEVGRPAGLKPGTPIDLPVAINLAPLPLEPDQRYEWRLWIDEDTQEEWRVGFTVRSADARH